jgi:hypothetical protein
VSTKARYVTLVTTEIGVYRNVSAATRSAR